MSSRELQTALNDAIEHIKHRINLGKQLWIGICGVPGSGKSHVSELLIRLAANEGISGVVVPADGYHYPRRILDQFKDPKTAHERRGEPFTFDVEKMILELSSAKESLTLSTGIQQRESFSFPLFDHAIGDPSGTVEVSRNHQLVVVEGLYLLLSKPEPWGKLRSIFDEIWYIDVDVPTALERVIERNSQAFGWDRARTRTRCMIVDKGNMDRILHDNPKAHADRIIPNP